MKNIFFCTLLLLLITKNLAQDHSQQFKGKLLDSVKVKDSSGETFSIYLPEKYSNQIPSSIVFIFEPGARSRIGIHPFVLAADTYNYILVCSDNSKNGPFDQNIEIATRLMNHVLSDYNINAAQMYIAGFSGGSRLAGSIALSSGLFQGVIACGASFSALDRLATPANNFSYVGLVGDNDMNFQEMVKNRTWLNKVNIRNELFVSNDGHEWPKQSEMLRAFDWLELQAYKKNIRQNNDSIVKRIYDKNIKIADSLKSSHQTLSAVEEYERIINNFTTRVINKPLQESVSELKKTKKYKEDSKKVAEIQGLEEEIFRKFSEKFDKELKSGKRDDFKFWKKELNNLSSNSKDEETHKMVRRILYRISTMAYESADEAKQAKEHHKVIYCNTIINIVDSVFNTTPQNK